MAKNGREVDLKNSDKTVFVCHALDAQDVLLAGSFDGWDPQATPMQPRGEGTWRAELELAPGLYEYKFVVDGA